MCMRVCAYLTTKPYSTTVNLSDKNIKITVFYFFSRVVTKTLGRSFFFLLFCGRRRHLSHDRCVQCMYLVIWKQNDSATATERIIITTECKLNVQLIIVYRKKWLFSLM